jgi:hypothetical protein
MAGDREAILVDRVAGIEPVVGTKVDVKGNVHENVPPPWA